MAYNFPVGYQPYYPSYQQMSPTQMSGTPQPQQNGIIWVQGEAGAKSYLVAPNTTVQLWDSENQVIYLKSADASGMPSMRVLDYTIRSEASGMAQNAFSDAKPMEVSKQDIEALQGQIDDLRGQLATLVKGERNGNKSAVRNEHASEV